MLNVWSASPLPTPSKNIRFSFLPHLGLKTSFSPVSISSWIPNSTSQNSLRALKKRNKRVKILFTLSRRQTNLSWTLNWVYRVVPPICCCHLGCKTSQISYHKDRTEKKTPHKLLKFLTSTSLRCLTPKPLFRLQLQVYKLQAFSLLWDNRL